MTEKSWDYLFVTAANDHQAQAYESQLSIREELGLLHDIENVISLSDPGGKRVGSGGSTIRCLLKVLELELAQFPDDERNDRSLWEQIFQEQHILIIHSGGDSRRLPSYATCGKLFTPLPIESDSAIPTTLFDIQLQNFLQLRSKNSSGQIVVTSGDVFLDFDLIEVDCFANGLSILGYPIEAEAASHHGVLLTSDDGSVRQFYQKPSVAKQHRIGAIDPEGRSILDVGVLNFDAKSAVNLLSAINIISNAEEFQWSGPVGEAIDSHGLDLYREFCCALGKEVTSKTFIKEVHSCGSKWGEDLLACFFDEIHSINFQVEILSECCFLHFGTSRELLKSGKKIQSELVACPGPDRILFINNDIQENGLIEGENSWVEASLISAPLNLEGENLVVGVDVSEPLSLPSGACLDVIPGHNRDETPVYFVRCFGIDDFCTGFENKYTGLFCGFPFGEWLETVGARPADVWNHLSTENDRTIWNARLFPAVMEPTDYRDWLWMYHPADSLKQSRRRWLDCDRYSIAEIATLVDHNEFQNRRLRIHTLKLSNSFQRLFQNQSSFSAADLSFAFSVSLAPTELLTRLLDEICVEVDESNKTMGMANFFLARILHTLATSIDKFADNPSALISSIFPQIEQRLSSTVQKRLKSLGISAIENTEINRLTDRLRSAAFASIRQTIMDGEKSTNSPPVCKLRSDEIVWARAPCRLDLAGGWTDTPPYSLENGGSVTNAAINLNGQIPIHTFVRPITEPLFRIHSIDQGQYLEISNFDELLTQESFTSEFNLVKLALVQTGFFPKQVDRNSNYSLRKLIEGFGGGLEITTLATVPQGSGLGTSSILGAVVLAAIYRVMGQALTQKELFYATLRLEQALTSGGGWQDQVGGIVGGTKLIFAEPGPIPDIQSSPVPCDLIDSQLNNKQTLLYYTGVNRPAKNILQKVVGRYLDRDRIALSTLEQLHQLSGQIAQALTEKEMNRFGKMIGEAWRLNKRLDKFSSNEETEQIMSLIDPYILGAKLLGAGGGGFLFMVCRSPDHARQVYQLLYENPPNGHARFYDFETNHEGITVSVC